LQVRDFPEDLYSELKIVSKAEGRSVPQQTVVAMRDYLEKRNNTATYRLRRQEIWDRLDRFHDEHPDLANCGLDPVALIREDRDR
jgi:hypothetical protein